MTVRTDLISGPDSCNGYNAGLSLKQIRVYNNKSSLDHLSLTSLRLDVFVKTARLSEFLAAQITFKVLFFRVNRQMLLKMGVTLKFPAAVRAHSLKRFSQGRHLNRKTDP